jgi:putative aminopeptidase FrvX
MESSPLLSILQRLMRQPTAPFHEHAVRAEVLAILAGFPDVQTEIDAFGNVHARYRRGDAPVACLLVAHMDHPGYVGETFLGGVPSSYLETRHPVECFGPFSMWDLPAFELRDGCIHSRACDDLVGCAVMLSLFECLTTNSTDATVTALFTRAEEVGLLGAVHAAGAGLISDRTPIVSLETSAERSPAAMHQGVIVRVGDKTTVFDSGLVGGLVSLAQAEDIPFQRCLMSGGTCEATAFQLYGYKSVGLCVALGNYHNCTPVGRIGSEYVSLADVEAMLALCVAAACRGIHGEAQQKLLRERLESGLAEKTSKYKHLV